MTAIHRLWKQHHDTELECLLSFRLSMRLIADRKGRTKNAVIGRNNRKRGYKNPSRGFVPKPPAKNIFPPAGRCAFPIGDLHKGGYFCGAPVIEFDMPYCAEHHRVTHIVPRPPQKSDTEET